MKDLGPLDYGRHKEFIAAALAGVDFFAPLTPDQIAELAGFIRLVGFEEGEIVFEKGAPGDSFYVIHTGLVQAVVSGIFGDKVIAEMGPKDFFGELALILKQPRAASIICAEPTQCFRLDSGDFAALLERNPAIAAVVKEVATNRYYNRP